jgi:hypothetical protein
MNATTSTAGPRESPLYDRIFRRLERARWQLADVPFDQIDAGRLTPEMATVVRVNCLMELSSLYATRMFLRDFRELPDFCQFISIWYYEEMKHYLVLRRYLEAIGPAPAPTDYPDLDTELAAGPWAPTLALHFCGEMRLGMWYHRWSEVILEPVLAGIYRRIGDDEFRHAACYRDFMVDVLERRPELLLDFLQAAKWMLVDTVGDKHPTTMKSDATGGRAVTDRIEGYQTFLAWIRKTIGEEQESELRRRVLATLSTLAGEPLNKMGDLAALTRRLRRAAAPSFAQGDALLAAPDLA